MTQLGILDASPSPMVFRNPDRLEQEEPPVLDDPFRKWKHRTVDAAMNTIDFGSNTLRQKV
jgi:hypothetical protein